THVISQAVPTTSYLTVPCNSHRSPPRPPTTELRNVAFELEILRRIQQTQNETYLDVDDFLITVIKTNKELAALIGGQRDFIGRETRSRRITFADGAVEAEYVVEWNDVDGHSVTIGVTPLHMSEALRDFTRIPGITV